MADLDQHRHRHVDTGGEILRLNPEIMRVEARRRIEREKEIELAHDDW
ncbi:MAG: hypothetical protein ACRYG4_04370 [Janthinobacterium lividum]